MAVRRHLSWLIPSSGVIIGGYLLITTLSPEASRIPAIQHNRQQAVLRKLDDTTGLDEDRLYIPAIGVDVAIVTGTNEAALNLGAWHRHPDYGDPALGGNFVLSAHRFRLGRTPSGTLKQSPFYHIDKLEPGDKIWVDFRKYRYEYMVQRRYSVKPNQTEIESPSSSAKLTLYSCTLRGSADGREVIEAVPAGQK